VDVLYSSLNYKDGLAITGKGKIIRGGFPAIPGIDLVGRVVESASAEYDAGDLVIGTGWNLGEVHGGGFTERQRVNADMLVPLPEGLAPRHAMTIGTAGFTAMLAVMALEEHGAQPGAGEVVVTGATGGAGSMAIALLARRGFNAVASTGSTEAHDYLTTLGAARIIGRDELGGGPARPMESETWEGAIDAVGGPTLASIIAQLRRHGSVASFGNAGGYKLETTVFPFILRGVNLLGIDSNECPTPRRKTAWAHLADLLDEAILETMTAEVIGLDDLPAAAERITDGQTQGRVVVEVSRS
jgi:acrylyl-CoA reductase (NADPH)